MCAENCRYLGDEINSAKQSHLCVWRQAGDVYVHRAWHIDVAALAGRLQPLQFVQCSIETPFKCGFVARQRAKSIAVCGVRVDGASEGGGLAVAVLAGASKPPFCGRVRRLILNYCFILTPQKRHLATTDLPFVRTHFVLKMLGHEFGNSPMEKCGLSSLKATQPPQCVDDAINEKCLKGASNNWLVFRAVRVT